MLILHAGIFKNCLISYLNNYCLEDRIPSLPLPPPCFSVCASLGKYPNHATEWGCKWMLNTLGRISFHLFCFIFFSSSCEHSLITRLKKNPTRLRLVTYVVVSMHLAPAEMWQPIGRTPTALAGGTVNKFYFVNFLLFSKKSEEKS